MVDWTKLLSSYENKWVAISEDEKSILASGKNLQDVVNKVTTKKAKARYTFVHSFAGIFAP